MSGVAVEPLSPGYARRSIGTLDTKLDTLAAGQACKEKVGNRLKAASETEKSR